MYVFLFAFIIYTSGTMYHYGIPKVAIYQANVYFYAKTKSFIMQSNDAYHFCLKSYAFLLNHVQHAIYDSALYAGA